MLKSTSYSISFAMAFDRKQLNSDLRHSFTDSVDKNLSKLWEIVEVEEPGVLQSMGSQSWT